MTGGGDPSEPVIVGNSARWRQRARALRAFVVATRRDHESIDFGFALAERDSAAGGGLLAGALAYRLFVFLLPTALLLVSGLGLYAGGVDESPKKVVADSGLHGLIASEVASAASGRNRGLIFLLAVPAFLYAMMALYRAIATVHAIAWHGSGRGVRTTRGGLGVFATALLLHFAALGIDARIRDRHQFGGLVALLGYLVLVGGAWLAVSTQLPHREVPWPALLPGAALFAAGLLLVNVFNIYVTTRLVKNRADTYGALGIATALLFSLVLVGRLIVVSAELNAALAERRARDG